jgi:ribosomal protein S18 acetylase RimI-like enzyme
MSVLVRVAEPGDFDEIARLTVAAYAADGQLEGGHGYEHVLADVATRAEHGELLVAVDASSGQPLGAVMFVLPGSRFAELSRDGEAEFRTLAVDPAAQRRGVAQALVRACLDRAIDLGCSALVISVRDFAEPARRLYAGFGFTRWPERDWSPMDGVQLLALRLPVAALAHQVEGDF